MAGMLEKYLPKLRDNQTLIFNDFCINKSGDYFIIDKYSNCSELQTKEQVLIFASQFHQVHNCFIVDRNSMDDDLYRK